MIKARLRGESNVIFSLSYANAAEKGIKKAIDAGSRAPLLFFAVKNRFAQAGTVAVLGALKALYVPIETREAKPEKAIKVDKIGVFGSQDKVGDKVNLVQALEAGRIVSRDIGGSDPERMAAPRYNCSRLSKLKCLEAM